jgi:hypothetical protein
MYNIDNIFCLLLLMFLILILLYLIYKKYPFCIKEHYYNTNCSECPSCESIQKQKDFCDKPWMYDKNDPERVKEGKKANCYNWKCYEDCYNKDCSITKNKSNTDDNTAEPEDDIIVIDNTAEPEDDIIVIDKKPIIDKPIIDKKPIIDIKPIIGKPIISKYCDKYEKQIKSLENNNKRLSDARNELKNELEQSKITLEKYIKDLEAKNDEYNKLEATCNNDELKDELEQSKIELEKYIAKLNAKIDEYNKLEATCNNDELKNELEQIKITLDKYIKDLAAKNDEYNKLEATCNNDANLQEKLSKTQKELNYLKINFAKDWNELSNQNNKLSGQNNRLVYENKKLNTIILEKKNCYRLFKN